MTDSLLFGFSFVGSVAATALALWYLRSRQILDTPNHRSSHAVPTPRGAGLALTPLILISFGVWFATHGAILSDWAMLAGITLLAVISWIDDRRTLSPAPRFAAQILAVAGVLSVMPASTITGGLLPSILEKLLLGLAWVWFVNLFNFMDGIDGITGIETLCIGVGLLLAAPGAVASGLLALLAGVTLGFLTWNWHPAKIFLGDVGSIPLGYLLGYFLLSAIPATSHGWAIALILPALYWSDATITLLRRALTGKAIWRAHREHFYQRATQGGWSHAQVSLLLLAGNLCLIGMAWFATAVNPWLALAGTGGITALILVLFQVKYQNMSNK
ncbi:MAG: glycosyltransferase family 4 protein [Rhodospirillaceae bacterium]|nr:glycosyltransferase family 4 protein [Rhodospirillaceae bacterium]